MDVMSKSIKIISMVFALIAVSGCGSLVTLNAAQSEYDKINDTTHPGVTQDAFLVEAARKFGLMALFAEAVYRRDLKKESRDGRGCEYLVNSESDQRHGMPHRENGKGYWKRWIPNPTIKDAPACFDEFGLYYETYIYEEAGQVTEAVIAFRGTENRNGQYFDDWRSNISAAIGFEPKQYELASKFVPLIVAGLKERFEDKSKVKIYATGHSLGGGLAQQTGYLSRDIKEVFAFNATPVTNWSFLRLRGAVKNGFPIIHRIHHGGEFLETPRFFSTAFTEARFGRHDIGLQFVGDERAAIKGHSMKVIACNFAKLIVLQQPAIDAEHHYPVSYIRQHVYSIDATQSTAVQICHADD